jgi:hypothetical protein
MIQILKPFFLSFSVLLLFLLILIVPGCNQSFDPFQENDEYIYSMFGYLDASADTQWVRVMPVRNTIFLEPEPIDVVVTLEHLIEGGDTVVLNDSLFFYGSGAYAWNFWTTMNLDPAQTYRLKAERSDGESSIAIVTLPEDFPQPYIETDPDRRLEYVYISGIESLADIHSNHRIRGKESVNNLSYTFSHKKDTVAVSVQRNEFIVQINPSDATIFMEQYYEEEPFDVLKREIFIANGGSNWPYSPNIDEEIIALPDGISNVENGLGYVSGIVSKTLTWEIACFDFDEEFPVSFPCPY